MDSGCISVELICIPADSGLIPVDSSGFQRNPVIPAGMVGGVTSTVNSYIVFENCAFQSSGILGF